MSKNIDLLKYICGVMVILIHVGLSNEIPLLRIAVPVFFLISAYLFSKGIDNRSSSNNDKLIKFITRAGKLYLFWFIVLLPITINFRHWDCSNIIQLIPSIICDLVLKSTFPASWYISAYVIGIVLIYTYRKQGILIWSISLLLYIICCFASSYYNLVIGTPLEKYISLCSDNYKIYNSFPVGLIYIAIGFNLPKIIKAIHLKASIFALIIGLSLLITESTLIKLYGSSPSNDCYFSNLILAPSLVIAAIKLPDVKLTYKITTTLRKMSTIYYCFHLSCIYVISQYYSLSRIQLVLIVFIICNLLSFLIIQFQQLKPFKILKYSY